MKPGMKREWLLACRNWTDFVNPIAFFLIVISLFPIASVNVAGAINYAPVIIWVAIMLAIVVDLPTLFQSDYEDGTLEQWRLSTESQTKRVLQRLLVHWLFLITPIALLLPIIGEFFALSWREVGLLFATIIITTPTLLLIGAIISALLLTARQASVLLAVLLLPLYIPVLLFAVSVFTPAVSLGGIFALLIALFAFSVSLAPLAVVAALSIS